VDGLLSFRALVPLNHNNLGNSPRLIEALAAVAERVSERRNPPAALTPLLLKATKR
jgi:hypothetical protein